MQGNDTDSPGPFLPSTSLAKSVLDELLVHVERLSSYDHRSLDDENVAWIPAAGISEAEKGLPGNPTRS
ncbi:hypothetical protein MRX96_024264 [Rhipicephalus microplus]